MQNFYFEFRGKKIISTVKIANIVSLTLSLTLFMFKRLMIILSQLIIALAVMIKLIC